MKEEVIATAQLAYQCPADAALSAQQDMIHDDLCRLLDADSTTGVACVTVTVAHVAPEAETYGNVEPSNVPSIQSDKMGETLSLHYEDLESEGEQLRAALCDLRHFADAHGLDFAKWDKSAHQIYRAERDQ